ncbi:MAG: homoserine dehydrogenase [Geminicoccaceae bacterium]
MVDPLRLGIAGLGTVGCGTLRILQEQGELIAQRSGRQLVVTAVSASDRSKNRPVDTSAYRWEDDALALANAEDIDVVVELIGGEDGLAKQLIETALESGKSVVTANKALLAHHGAALAARAEQSGAVLAYEAGVAGGIPIVKALRDGLVGNRIERVYGILNGTCNYILSSMRETARDFDQVLTEAQALGFAEADPSFDVDGIDAAHKLALLASIAFGTKPAFDASHIEGIRQVSALDITFAEELGYRIKLLGVVRMTSAGLEQRVHPTMVGAGRPIAQVEGVYNAVVAEGDSVGTTLFVGRGAGAEPTGSAVVADLCDLARGWRVPAFGTPAPSLIAPVTQPMTDHFGAYYLRLMVDDQTGVLAEIAACLRDEDVSVETMIQRQRASDQPVPIVLTTHESKEARLTAALDRIAALASVREPPMMIRIETL